MKIEKPEPDVHVLIGDTYSANATVLTAGDEAFLIDAMASRADALALRAYVEEELGKRVRFILSTHYFSDHLAALQLFPRADIIAHRNFAHTFESERFRTAEEEGHFVEPTIVVSDELRIRFGRFTLEIFHNPGHTMSTLGVDVAAADLLFAGDTLVGNIVYVAYTAPSLLDEALVRLQRRGRSRVISSHDGVRDAAAIDRCRFYLASLQRRAREAWQSSGTMSIPLEECLAPGVAATDFERLFHERNLESIAERRLFIRSAA